jgi:hypothetical protein
MAERKQFLLRIDPLLWAELEAWAADELRSVNGQIEYILREAVRKRRGAGRKGQGDEGSSAEGADGQSA